MKKTRLNRAVSIIKGFAFVNTFTFLSFFSFFFLFINFYSASPCLFDGGWTGPLVRTLRTKAQHSNVFLKSVP